MRIIGVILAAGKSSRMNQNKLLLHFKNHTILEEVLHQLIRSQVEDVLVVTGFERTQIEDLLASINNDKIRITHNKNYELGRTESIKCAIDSLRGESADALLFMVADKPTVTTELIDRAIEEFKRIKPAILYVKTPTGRGHPIIFSKDLFGGMMTLTGDDATECFIKRHQNKVVEIKDDAIQVDINTWEDYQMLCG